MDKKAWKNLSCKIVIKPENVGNEKQSSILEYAVKAIKERDEAIEQDIRKQLFPEDYKE